MSPDIFARLFGLTFQPASGNNFRHVVMKAWRSDSDDLFMGSKRVVHGRRHYNNDRNECETRRQVGAHHRVTRMDQKPGRDCAPKIDTAMYHSPIITDRLNSLSTMRANNTPTPARQDISFPSATATICATSQYVVLRPVRHRMVTP